MRIRPAARLIPRARPLRPDRGDVTSPRVCKGDQRLVCKPKTTMSPNMASRCPRPAPVVPVAGVGSADLAAARAPRAGHPFRNLKDRRFPPRPPGTAIALPGRGITDGPLWLRCRPSGQHPARPSPRSGVTAGICGPLAHGVDLGATRPEDRPCIGNRPCGVTDDGRPPPSGADRPRRALRRPASRGRPGGELGWDSWGGRTAAPTTLAGRRRPAARPTNPPSRRA